MRPSRQEKGLGFVNPTGRAMRSVALLVWLILCGCDRDGGEFPVEDPDLPVRRCAGEPLTGEPDRDQDGVTDRCDLCPDLADPAQRDADHDGLGDGCDEDDDDDGVLDEEDTCPLVFQHDQRDGDGDGLGDVCDLCPALALGTDRDQDGVDDCVDLCPKLAEANNADADQDGVGDACDLCPAQPDASQLDLDEDGIGDACQLGGAPSRLQSWSAEKIAGAILDGELTCEALVREHLSAIQRFDLDVSDGPPINAFVMLNPQILDQARELDLFVQRHGELKGELHCAPVVVKDLYNTVEMEVSAGTLSMLGTKPNQDATVVARLRDQGALILGVTTMDELSKGIHGISGRSGRTGNAYAPERSPGGSSSGSGAAVGAGFALGGLGTDNCASLTVPASYNGLVTLRPTLGLISMHGVFPSNYLDATAGPMARSLPDLALMLDAMAGVDDLDPRTQFALRPQRFTDHLISDGLRHKRVGVVRRYGDTFQERPTYGFAGAQDDTLLIYNHAIAKMDALGATIVENITLTDLDTNRASAGFADEVEEYFRSLIEGPYESFYEVCEQDRFSQFAYASSQQCRAAMAWNEEFATVGSPYTEREQERYRRNARYLEAVLDALDLDALLLPVDPVGGAPTSYYSLTHCVVGSVTGAPAMVFRAGYSSSSPNMPVGMMLLGRRFDEATLLEMAYAYEHAQGARRPATLTSAVDPLKVPRRARF